MELYLKHQLEAATAVAVMVVATSVVGTLGDTTVVGSTASGGYRHFGGGFYSPYYYAGGYDSCYRRVWIGGPHWRRLRWVNVCG